MAADFEILRLAARDVVAGDEILSGPQGRIPEAPTVLRIAARPDGVLAATLRDESGDEVALWNPSSPIVVYRLRERV